VGRRGPAPTPTNILRLRGSPRVTQRRLKSEVKPPAGRPTCPDWLDEEATHAWRWLIPLLEGMGILTRIDRNALTRYCQHWSRWKKAEQFIQEHGDTYPIKDDDGKIKCLQQFPQVAIAHRLSLVMTRLEQEFGMTPSARSRIQLPSEVKRDPRMDRYFIHTA